MNAFIGEVLHCEAENDNEFDKNAVALKNENGHVVGHIPIELSKVFVKFLQNYGEIEGECIGSRYILGKGNGMKLPIDYRFIGNEAHLMDLRRHCSS